MPAAVPLGLLAVSAASTAFAGYNANKSTPDIPSTPPPPSATTDEKAAQEAGMKAKRQMMTAIGSDSGRGSTILTGGKLGDPGAGAGTAKTLLGT